MKIISRTEVEKYWNIAEQVTRHGARFQAAEKSILLAAGFVPHQMGYGSKFFLKNKEIKMMQDFSTGKNYLAVGSGAVKNMYYAYVVQVED